MKRSTATHWTLSLSSRREQNCQRDGNAPSGIIHNATGLPLTPDAPSAPHRVSLVQGHDFSIATDLLRVGVRDPTLLGVQQTRRPSHGWQWRMQRPSRARGIRLRPIRKRYGRHRGRMVCGNLYATTCADHCRIARRRVCLRPSGRSPNSRSQRRTMFLPAWPGYRPAHLPGFFPEPGISRVRLARLRQAETAPRTRRLRYLVECQAGERRGPPVGGRSFSTEPNYEERP